MLDSIKKSEGIIFLLIGILGLLDSLRLIRVTVDELFGPGWYLLVLSFILIVSGIYYIKESYKKGKSRSSLSYSTSKLPPAVLTIFALCFYTLAMIFLGYLISTAVFLALTMYIFGERSMISAIIFGCVGGFAFWFFFIYLANIPLP